MKIISWNVNGIRSAAKQGFENWFAQTKAAAICLQELKIDESHINELPNFVGYDSYFNFAQKKGYSGTAIYIKNKFQPQKIQKNLGLKRFDCEGRYLELHFVDFILINIYLPHGGRAKENLAYKLNAYQKLFTRLKQLKNKKVILCGDFNIAHTEDDLARPRNNKNNIMFTPEERKKIDQLLKLKLIDSFRQFHQGNRFYTWWPWLNNCRARNIGWRLDYIFVSQSLKNKLKNSLILKNVFGSDHAPIKTEIAC
jgi:exodeoxyribonuclease-3